MDYEQSKLQYDVKNVIKSYLALTKPGILMGNLITTSGGFILASKGFLDVKLFLATLLGLSMVMASGCVLNHATDRKADAKMARTKNRPIVRGVISPKNALIFASALLFCGLLLLLKTNLLAAAIALTGFFFYVILYGIVKYRSSFGTFVGSIAGATPPVVGYCAASGRFDLLTALVLAVMIFWQMPHFHAIAIYRLNEYTAAAIPVLPVVKGIAVTKKHMFLYIAAFTATAATLMLFEHTGYVYPTIAVLLGISWLSLSVRGFKKDTNDTLWAKRMFRLSLIVITGISALLCV